MSDETDASEVETVRFDSLAVEADFTWRGTRWHKTDATHAVCPDSQSVELEEHVPNAEPVTPE